MYHNSCNIFVNIMYAYVNVRFFVNDSITIAEIKVLSYLNRQIKYTNLRTLPENSDQLCQLHKSHRELV